MAGPRRRLARLTARRRRTGRWPRSRGAIPGDGVGIANGRPEAGHSRRGAPRQFRSRRPRRAQAGEVLCAGLGECAGALDTWWDCAVAKPAVGHGEAVRPSYRSSWCCSVVTAGDAGPPRRLPLGWRRRAACSRRCLKVWRTIGVLEVRMGSIQNEPSTSLQVGTGRP